MESENAIPASGADRPARLKVPRGESSEIGVPLCQWMIVLSCQPPSKGVEEAAEESRKR